MYWIAICQSLGLQKRTCNPKGEAFSPPKENIQWFSTSKHKISLPFFLFMCAIFASLDPDPDPADQNQCGSETLYGTMYSIGPVDDYKLRYTTIPQEKWRISNLVKDGDHGSSGVETISVQCFRHWCTLGTSKSLTDLQKWSHLDLLPLLADPGGDGRLILLLLSLVTLHNRFSWRLGTYILKGPKHDQVGYEFFLHKADPYG